MTRFVVYSYGPRSEREYHGRPTSDRETAERRAQRIAESFMNNGSGPCRIIFVEPVPEKDLSR